MEVEGDGHPIRMPLWTTPESPRGDGGPIVNLSRLRRAGRHSIAAADAS
jgi:hypothetical protein